jgi:hypothetical protein
MSSMNDVPTEQFEHSKQLTSFMQDVHAVAASATPEDRGAAKAVMDPSGKVREVSITPQMAAVIFCDFNKRNRDLSVTKAREYEGAMKRGEWKRNHQGIAVYKTGLLGDGQHRMAAIALSGEAQVLVVFPGLDESAVDSIDIAKSRNAGDALQMSGIENGRLKAAIGKTAMEYAAETAGTKSKPTVIQLERYVTAHDGQLATSIAVGERSVEKVADPCLSISEAATAAYLMHLAGYHQSHIAGFIASIQQGIEDRENGVIVPAAKVLHAARRTDVSKDRLTKREKMALIMKAAALWTTGKSVAKFKFSRKEPLPRLELPEGLDESAS